MSSRLLFSAGHRLTDLDKPPHSPQKKRFLIPFPLPRVPLPRFATKQCLLLPLLLLFLCHRTRSLHCTVLCLPPVVLSVVYFLFKNRSRLPLLCLFKKKQPMFFVGGQAMNAKEPTSMSCGTSVESSAGGTVYAGEFCKGSRTGKGVLRIPRKSIYMGDWIDGAYDGYGIERLAVCGEYIGKFWKGARHGFGSMQFYNGDIYNGEWRYGERDGTGEQTCAAGSSYVGEFKKGMKHGVGTYRFRLDPIFPFPTWPTKKEVVI